MMIHLIWMPFQIAFGDSNKCTLSLLLMFKPSLQSKVNLARFWGHNICCYDLYR